MLFYGRGGFLPLPLPCQLFYQKQNCNDKIDDCGNKIDCACLLVFLIAAFLMRFLAQCFYPPFLILIILYTYVYVNSFLKNVKKFTPTGKNPPGLLNAQKPQNRYAEDFCEYRYFIVRNKPRPDLNAADRIALHNYALDLNARREV